MLPTSSGQRPERLLNILLCSGQPVPLFPSCQSLSRALNVSSAQAEKPWSRGSLFSSPSLRFLVCKVEAAGLHQVMPKVPKGFCDLIVSLARG